MSNPNFKVIKPVRWGVNQPGPDVLVLTEEMVEDEMNHDDVTMKVAEEMQDAGYIEILDSEEEEVELSEIRKTIAGIVDSASGKREAKDNLETWAKDNLDGYDLDKSKSLEDCIEDIVAVHDDSGE